MAQLGRREAVYLADLKQQMRKMVECDDSCEIFCEIVLNGAWSE